MTLPNTVAVQAQRAAERAQLAGWGTLDELVQANQSCHPHAVHAPSHGLACQPHFEAHQHKQALPVICVGVIAVVQHVREVDLRELSPGGHVYGRVKHRHLHVAVSQEQPDPGECY